MQHRSNPILGTLESVPGPYPESLKIYRVPCSPYYYMRVHMNGKMIPRSTKTKNKELAKKAAADFYDELILKRAQKLPLTEGGQFKRVFVDLQAVDQAKVDRGDKAKSLTKDATYIFKKDLLPFFKNDQLHKITYQRIQEYVTKLEDARSISSKTLKNHLVVLSKILKHAHKMNLLDKLPIFPELHIEDNPREWFNEQQYAHLKHAVTKEIKAKTMVNHHPITNELLYLTVFLANSFLRPSDITVLRNRDITVVKDDSYTYLRIVAKAKTKELAIVTMPICVDVYERLNKLNKNLGFGKPDDFVFFPAMTTRSYATQTMQRQFRHVLVKYGLKTGAQGRERTLYSLRHSCIMFRLKNGDIDIFLLARNCRTSVDMINRFYGVHLQPEMYVEKIHSLRKGKVGQGPIAHIEDFIPD